MSAIIVQQEAPVEDPDWTAVGISELGWSPPETLPYETWEKIMTGLFQTEQSLKWVIGDGLNFGERRYGEMYAQAIEMTGLDYQTLANYKYVARNVPPHNRNLNLYWTAHKIVASLDDDLQEYWLTVAEENSWSTRQLNDAVLGKKTPEQINDEPGKEIVIKPDRGPRSPRALLYQMIGKALTERERREWWLSSISEEEWQSLAATRDDLESVIIFAQHLKELIDAYMDNQGV